MKDITPDVLTPAALKRLRGVKTARLRSYGRIRASAARWPASARWYASASTTTDHAEEVGMALPKEPTVFIKRRARCAAPTMRRSGPRRRQLGYECELAAVIGRDARNVDDGRRSARRRLLHRERRLRARLPDGARRHPTKGKSADTFGPVGMAGDGDEVGDPQALELWTTVNGERRQQVPPPQDDLLGASLVAYVSRFMSLRRAI